VTKSGAERVAETTQLELNGLYFSPQIENRQEWISLGYEDRVAEDPTSSFPQILGENLHSVNSRFSGDVGANLVPVPLADNLSIFQELTLGRYW